MVLAVLLVLNLPERCYLLSLKAELTAGLSASRTNHLDYGPMTASLHPSKAGLATSRLDPHLPAALAPADPSPV